MLRADYVLRAVPVSAGRHRLEMRYRPLPLLAGLVLSASGWVLLAVLLLAARARERPTAGRVPR